MITRAARAGVASDAVRRLDWPLVLASAGLIFFGLLSLYSADTVSVGHSHFKRQLLWMVVAIPFCALFWFVDPRKLASFSKVLYALNLTLLVAVFFLGKEAKGSVRWIDLGPFQIQPSEIAKLFVILTLADVLIRFRDELPTIRGLLLSLLHVAIPFVLVFKQPDLGTSIVFVCIWFGMSLVAGQRKRYLLGCFIVGLGAFALLWNSGFIRDYQKARVEALFSGDDYHSRMARYSIGYGGVTGQGYLRGDMKASRLVPEQTTDFIFTVIAEEWGFIGSTLVVVGYAYFLWRVWLVAANASVRLYRYIAAGIYVVFAFHIVVNLLMVVGLLPVVGVPLPFFSRGGSALVLNFSMVALLLNLRAREKHLVF